MKKILYTLFLIPCLCFGQLGINTTEPKAMLHISKSESSKNALKIEGIEKTPYKAEQRHLLIGDDGTLKKEKQPEKFDRFKSNKYYFAQGLILDKIIEDVPLDQRVNQYSDGYKPVPIKIPNTSSYLVYATFYGEYSTSVQNLGNTTFGTVTMSIYDASNPNNEILLEKVEMKWVIPKMNYNRDKVEYSTTYTATTEIYAKKGAKLRIQLEAVKTEKAKDITLNLSPIEKGGLILKYTKDFISNIILFQI